MADDPIVETFRKATTAKSQAEQVVADHNAAGDVAVLTEDDTFWIVTTTLAAPAGDDPA